MIYHHETEPTTEPQHTLKSWARWKRGTHPQRNVQRFKKQVRETYWEPRGDFQGGETNRQCQILSHPKSQENSYIFFCKVHSWLSWWLKSVFLFWALDLDLQLPSRYLNADSDKWLRWFLMSVNVTTLRRPGAGCHDVLRLHLLHSTSRHHFHVFQIKTFI